MANRGSTRRTDRGRSHSYALDGAKVDGVTTILSKALPKPALVPWAAKETAGFAYDSLSLIQQMKRDEAVDFLKGAPYRDRDRNANRGTEVHKLAQQLASGHEIEVPDELAGHVDSYLRFLDDWQPSEELLERSVYSRQWRYAGTLDMLCQLPGYGQALLDIKTNRSGPFGETALQMAAYANADFMLGDKREELPLPEIDFYGVVWVRADDYDLYPFQVTEQEWKAFLHLRWMAWWIDEREKKVKGDALYRPAEEVTA
jgi:hypothetical protein